MKSPINTLEELEKEIEKLKLQKGLAKTGFSQSLRRTQSKAKGLLIKKVALPAVAVGLTTVAAKMMSASRAEGKSENMVQQKAKFSLLSLMPVLIPVLRVFLLKYNIDLNDMMDGSTPSKQSDLTIE